MKQRSAASRHRLWLIMTSLEVLDVLFWVFWVDVSHHFGVVVTPKSCETVDEQSVRSISEQTEQTSV